MASKSSFILRQSRWMCRWCDALPPWSMEMIRKIAWALVLFTATSFAVEGPGLNTFWYKGNQVDVQTLDGVTVQASLITSGKFNRVDIRVLNRAKTPIIVQPESIALTITGPGDDIDLAALSEKEVVHSISDQLLISNALVGFVASASSQRSTLTPPFLPPPTYAGAEAARLKPSRSELSTARREKINELLLQRITLFPDQTTMGSVFFRGGAISDGALITVGLGTRLYNLPFGGGPSPSVPTLEAHNSMPGPAGASAPESDTPATVPEIEHGGNPLYYVLGIIGTKSRYEGFEITAVTPNSPAARAGLRAQDDTILSVNGVHVNTADEINHLLVASDPAKITVTLMHQYWQEEKIISLH